MKKTNSQKLRLYEAEDTVPPGIVFSSILQAQKYVDRITLSPAWFSQGPQLVEVVPGKESYAKFPNLIALRADHMNQLVALHELAHLLTPDEQPDHGPRFAGAYLWLAHQFWGQFHFEALRLAFGRHGVVWTPRT